MGSSLSWTTANLPSLQHRYRLCSLRASFTAKWSSLSSQSLSCHTAKSLCLHLLNSDWTLLPFSYFTMKHTLCLMASKSTYTVCALAFQEFSQSWKTVKVLHPQTVATTKITFYKFADYCQVPLSVLSHTYLSSCLSQHNLRNNTTEITCTSNLEEPGRTYRRSSTRPSFLPKELSRGMCWLRS